LPVLQASKFRAEFFSVGAEATSDRGGSNQYSALLERQDCTLVAWYRSLCAPRTGGAYDSHHRTAGIAGRIWRRCGSVAARVIGRARMSLVLPAGNVTSPRSSRPLTARALRCCFRLRRRSDPRGSRSLLQPHQLHRFPIIARRLLNRNVYSCIDGCIVHRWVYWPRGGSRMPARLWIRCTTRRFHQSVNNRRVF